jgi:hypothetical protein
VILRLTPSWGGDNEVGDDLLADEAVSGWGWADEAVNDIVGGAAHQVGDIWWFGARRTHHHAKGKLFLQNTLKVHHVQVTHDSTINNHYLVTLDDAYRPEKKHGGLKIILVMRLVIYEPFLRLLGNECAF